MGQLEKLLPGTGEEKDKGSQKMAELRNEFANLKEKAVNKATRIVRLKVFTGCGCGGSYTAIGREVPFDSPLQTGDTVYNIEKKDEVI